jgi:hypothetical protein
MAVGVALVLPGTARAADPRFPDWPCVQLKVPEISVAAIWAGPPIDDVGDAWAQDPAVRDLAARLAVRRTSLDDAQMMIAGFVTGSPEERQRKATLLFAGLFKSLNSERGDVMNAIERFFRQHRTFAEKVRAEITELHDLQDAPNHDQGKVDELANRVEWDTRIFEERKKTISYVCEVPTLIEQRLFSLARTIQEAME